MDRISSSSPGGQAVSIIIKLWAFLNAKYFYTLIMIFVPVDNIIFFSTPVYVVKMNCFVYVVSMSSSPILLKYNWPIFMHAQRVNAFVPSTSIRSLYSFIPVPCWTLFEAVKKVNLPHICMFACDKSIWWYKGSHHVNMVCLPPLAFMLEIKSY